VILLRPSACLLQLVSWLLVAFIPGLLMVATFGLGRLEASLDGDIVSPEDVAAVLEQAKADCAKPPARGAVEHAYEMPETGYRKYVFAEPAQGLPTRVLIHHAANPEFQATRHAYRV
jgi:hypothetical protein